MLRIDPPDGPLRADGKILKAKDYAAMVQANDIVEEAKRQAELKAREAQTAFEEEKERGHAEGLVEAKREAAEMAVESTMKAVTYLSSVEASVVKVVVQALERVMGAVDDEDLVLGIVKTALAAERDQRRVVVQVHPSKVDYLETHLDELHRKFHSIQLIEVVADPKLSEAGCVLKSDLGTIDASLETQLEAIRNALEKNAPDELQPDEGASDNPQN